MQIKELEVPEYSPEIQNKIEQAIVFLINKINTGMDKIAIVSKICFVFTLPINIISMLVPPISNAVDKFDGAINKQIITTGVIIGRNPFLNSLITVCLRLN